MINNYPKISEERQEDSFTESYGNWKVMTIHEVVGKIDAVFFCNFLLRSFLSFSSAGNHSNAFVPGDEGTVWDYGSKPSFLHVHTVGVFSLVRLSN